MLGRKVMEILTHHIGVKRLVELFSNNALIPIIGSGFTGGSPAFEGKVPMGQDLCEIMIKTILNYSKDETQDSLNNLDFDELAEIFLDEDVVPKFVRLDIFKKYFTGVSLPAHKVSFLKIWKYIYTINIDDGIETATNYKAILPYSSLRKESTNFFKQRNYVLKLHGDATQEILCDNQDNMVLSSSQYISSLRSPKNANLLASVYSDYKQKNLIFIGCSLKKEPDLQQLYKEIGQDRISTDIIYLCKDEPSDKEKRALRKYGVNKLILVEDYDALYKDLVSAVKSIPNTSSSEYKFFNPQAEILSSKKEILRLLGFGRPVFDLVKGKFYIPICVAQRNLFKTVLRELQNNDFIFIKGRRLSGKTTFLQSLISHMPNYSTYYFPSGYDVDISEIKDQIATITNGLLVFDSNSLTPELYTLIISLKNNFKQNHTKIIVASNTNEDNLINSFGADSEYLNNKFSSIELEEFNEGVNKLAFISRSDNQTSLDYAYKLMEQQNLDAPFSKYKIESMSFNQKVLLYLLTIFDRVYFHEILNLDFRLSDIDSFISEYPELFEIIDCDPYESDGKSVKKIVHNSKNLTLSLVSRMSKEMVSEVIKIIVKKLYLNDSQQYKTAIMFDTLNQIFSKHGSGLLIDHVYKELESILYNEHHFWLQRAKSIYRLFKNDRQKLEEARKFALKPLNDPGVARHIKVKASFTLSLIYGLLYQLADNNIEKEKFQISSIEFAHPALVGRPIIATSIQNEIVRTIDGSTQGAFEMLKYLSENFINPDNKRLYPIIVEYAIDILKKLNSMKNMNHPRFI